MNIWIVLSALVAFCVWKEVDWRGFWDGEARIVAAMLLMFVAFVVGFTDLGGYLLRRILS